MRKLTVILTVALALAAAFLPACTSQVNPDGTPSTQPSFNLDSALALAIADYDAFVELGIVKETPELDYAIAAYFSVKKDIAAGKPTAIAINDALINVAAAIHNARIAKTGK